MAANIRRWRTSALITTAVVVAAIAVVMVEGNYTILMGGRRAVIEHIKGNNAAARASLCQVRDELIQESALWREKIHSGLRFQHSASATCANPHLVSDSEVNSNTSETADGACDNSKKKAKDKAYEAANAATTTASNVEDATIEKSREAQEAVYENDDI